MPRSNPVGYNQTGLQNNFKAAGLSFISVGGDAETDLMTVTVTGYGDTAQSGQVAIQTLDDMGFMSKTYQWHDYTKKDKKSGETIHYYGWYNLTDGKYVEDEEVIFPAGAGLWVQAYSEDIKLVCNGQVLTPAIAVRLQENFTMVGNPYPCDVNLTAMWVSGYTEAEAQSGQIACQTLDDMGFMSKTYQWHDYTKKDKKSGQTVHYYGWYNLTDGKYVEGDEIIVHAGDALWVQAPANPNPGSTYPYCLNFPELNLK